MHSPRRIFLGALASLGGLALLRSASPSRLLGQRLPPAANRTKWDLSFLDTLTGDHRQVFDVGSLEVPLYMVTNFLDAHEEVFGLKPPRINAVVGIARAAYPINATDAIWAKYELGRRWSIKDPATGGWATRNVYLEKMPAPPGMSVGVKPLMARGVIFWMCNNAMNRIVADIAADTKQERPALRAELIEGLLPGVILVPAHTMLLGLCQERGCSYERV